MTKLRHPLTFENALTKVASVIGWPTVAKIVGHAENTVRNWSDPDTSAKITLEAAFRLDLEFCSAGGEGMPFLDCYANRVETGRYSACPEVQALIDGAAKVAQETGQAIAATLKAAAISAPLADMAIAEREIEDAISAGQNSLALIRARKDALLNGQTACGCPEGSHVGTGEPPEQPARAAEVAPPAVTA